MTDDLAAIKSWASIFTDPSALAAKVAKHYAFHKAAIQADIAAVEADWESGLYFRTGADLAALLTLAVGPIETNNGIDLPPVEAVPDFTAGLIYGFTGHDHREELEGCMTDIEPLVDDAKAALADIASLNLIKGVMDLGDIIWMLPEAVESCGELGNLQEDIDAMLAWAEVLKEPTRVAKIASKNWLFHGVAVKKAIAEEESDWSSGDYYGAGTETAVALLTLVPLNSLTAALPFEQ